jgi:hypothetical protein
LACVWIWRLNTAASRQERSQVWLDWDHSCRVQQEREHSMRRCSWIIERRFEHACRAASWCSLRACFDRWKGFGVQSLAPSSLGEYRCQRQAVCRLLQRSARDLSYHIRLSCWLAWLTVRERARRPHTTRRSPSKEVPSRWKDAFSSPPAKSPETCRHQQARIARSRHSARLARVLGRTTLSIVSRCLAAWSHCVAGVRSASRMVQQTKENAVEVMANADRVACRGRQWHTPAEAVLERAFKVPSSSLLLGLDSCQGGWSSPHGAASCSQGCQRALAELSSSHVSGWIPSSDCRGSCTESLCECSEGSSRYLANAIVRAVLVCLVFGRTWISRGNGCQKSLRPLPSQGTCILASAP